MLEEYRLAKGWSSVGGTMFEEKEQQHAQRPAWPTGGTSRCFCTGVGRGGWQGRQGSGHPQLSVSVEDFGLRLWEAIEGFYEWCEVT